MMDLDELLAGSTGALAKAEAVSIKEPPSGYKSIDDIYKYYKGSSLFTKVFSSQRSLMTFVQSSKVTTWSHSSEKGKAVDGEGITYPRFYFDVAEFAVAMTKAFEKKADELKNTKESAQTTLNKKYPDPLQVLQGALNGRRVSYLRGTKREKVKAHTETLLKGVDDAQKKLTELKEAQKKADKKNKLKSAQLREDFLDEQYSDLVNSDSFKEIAGVVDLNMKKRDSKNYVPSEWVK